LSHQKPKHKKRPREWHHGPKEDRRFRHAARALASAHPCVRCNDTGFAHVGGIGILCECCFDGWWAEERLGEE
jgi:hypothetical protein